MRKYVVGFLVGLMVASTFPAYGEVSSLVGKKIQAEYPIVVNGKPLETKAIVVNGFSYTPNRALAEAIGGSANFENKTVLIESEDAKVELAQIDARLMEIIKIQGIYSDRYEELRTKWNSVPQDQRDSVQAEIDALMAEVAPYTQEREQLIPRKQQLEKELGVTP